MLISEIIEKIKDYSNGYEKDFDTGLNKSNHIDDKTSRDQVLYGEKEQECKGIVTCLWASYDVILEAIRLKANFIICHEALFYNHGDHTDWLNDNKTFLKKKQLLDDYHICVWRYHDYMHSGIPLNDVYTDGIFYGVADKLGWINNITGNICNPMSFKIKEMTVKDLSKFLIERLNLNGVRIYGNPNRKVEKIRIAMHIFGDANEYIKMANNDEVDCFLTMELVDFTLAEYINDASMCGFNKSIISMGHFNLEEYGMEYMVKYLKKLVCGINVTFVRSGDHYSYITK